MKLGARIIKTGLAVVLSLYIATWLGLEPPTFAALAAAFAVQPSLYRSFQTILEQVQANVIGAVLAVIFVMTFGQEPFVIGLVVSLTIAIILMAKLESSTIPLTIVTVVIVMESPVTDFIEFATERFILILLGVLAAFIVNLLFIPPRYETKLYNEILKTTEDMTQWIMLVIRFDADHQMLKDDIKRLDDKILQTDNLYTLYKEERNYFLRNKYAKARKVVLFRQMILTSKEALSLLRILERSVDILKNIPEQTHIKLRDQLEHLTSYHDLILLRYAGKIHSLRTKELIEEMNEGNEVLMNFFIHLREVEGMEHDQWLSLLPVVSKMSEYQAQLEHLNELVESFSKYHQRENKAVGSINKSE